MSKQAPNVIIPVFPRTDLEYHTKERADQLKDSGNELAYVSANQESKLLQVWATEQRKRAREIYEEVFKKESERLMKQGVTKDWARHEASRKAVDRAVRYFYKGK